MTQEQVDLLRRVQDDFRQHPECVDMEHYGVDNGISLGLDDVAKNKNIRKHACGTAACILGRMVILASASQADFPGNLGSNRALFHEESWPHDLQVAYQKSHSAAAIRAIDVWIDNNGSFP